MMKIYLCLSDVCVFGLMIIDGSFNFKDVQLQVHRGYEYATDDYCSGKVLNAPLSGLVWNSGRIWLILILWIWRPSCISATTFRSPNFSFLGMSIPDTGTKNKSRADCQPGHCLWRWKLAAGTGGTCHCNCKMAQQSLGMRYFKLNHVSSLGDTIPTGRFAILTISKKRGTSFCSDGMPGCVCFHRHFIKSFVLQVFGDGWHLPRIISCSLPICICPTIFLHIGFIHHLQPEEFWRISFGY